MLARGMLPGEEMLWEPGSFSPATKWLRGDPRGSPSIPEGVPEGGSGLRELSRSCAAGRQAEGPLTNPAAFTQAPALAHHSAPAATLAWVMPPLHQCRRASLQAAAR